jgi:hypothetical protein
MICNALQQLGSMPAAALTAAGLLGLLDVVAGPGERAASTDAVTFARVVRAA